MTPQEEGRLITTVEHLSLAVEKLTRVVERLEAKKNFTAGVVTGVGMVSAAIGGIAATALQWFHK